MASRGFSTGDRVIYFYALNFSPAPARVGCVIRVWDTGEGQFIDVRPDTEKGTGYHHVSAKKVHPYNPALWAAWEQYQVQAAQLDEYHKKLQAGKIPPQLLLQSLWEGTA